VSDDSASEQPAAPVSDPDPEADPSPSPLRRTLDYFVFAPVGLALTALEDLPGLVTKGRNLVETEISNARVVGKFVVDRGVREITQRVTGRAGGGIADGDEADGSDVALPDLSFGAAESTGTEDRAAPPAPPAAPAAPKPAPDPADGVAVEQALADYDTLSASQVVRRLESLGPDELRAVHRHEASHRNRRTILNRTSQLLGDGGTTPLTAAE
jgi:hypothetical protein